MGGCFARQSELLGLQVTVREAQSRAGQWSALLAASTHEQHVQRS